MTAAPPGYGRKSTAPAPPPGYSKAAPAEAPAGAPAPDDPYKQGLLQQMFDIRNAATGESYLYGN